MSEEDTEAPTTPTEPDRARQVQHGAPPRADDRNEELDQSPVPDPEEKRTGAGDDPQAD